MTRRVILSLAILVLCLRIAPAHMAPSTARAAGNYVFEADMYGYNVLPPVNTQAWGFFRFFFDDSHTTADITIDVKGISNSLVTGADIRRGRPGTNGPVVRHLSDGGFIVTAAHIKFTPSELVEMASGNWYAVLMTTDNPEGEMRGQILPPADFLTPGSTAPAHPYAQPPSVPGQPGSQQFIAPPQPTPTASPAFVLPPPPAVAPPRPAVAQPVALPPSPPLLVRPPNTGDAGLLACSCGAGGPFVSDSGSDLVH